jgi:hypothetical protein
MQYESLGRVGKSLTHSGVGGYFSDAGEGISNYTVAMSYFL